MTWFPNRKPTMATVFFLDNGTVNYDSKKAKSKSFVNWCWIKTIKAAAFNRKVIMLLKCHSFYQWHFHLLNFSSVKMRIKMQYCLLWNSLLYPFLVDLIFFPTYIFICIKQEPFLTLANLLSLAELLNMLLIV